MTFGFTALYLGLLVLIPLAALFAKAGSKGWGPFIEAAFSPRAAASYRITFGVSLGAALFNAVFGTIAAWTLVRYPFPGRRILDALIDLPFALPTAVSGIALTTLFARQGWFGGLLDKAGIKAAYNPAGIGIALVFIGLPFVIRTLQPALEGLEKEHEEAASSLGASRGQTFLRVTLPAILPALLTGFALAFARGLGEYGSVIFIAGNRPMKTEVSTLLIVSKLEQYDYAGAAAIAVVMLVASFLLLLGINLIERRYAGRTGRI
jgi:sulfate transport system permease protein